MAYVLNQNQKQKTAPQVTTDSAPTGGVGTQAASSPGASPQKFTKSNYGDTNAIINRNKDLTSTAIGDRVVKPAAQQSAAHIDKMQNKAGNYVAGETQRADMEWAQPGQESVSAAMAGDNDAYGTLSKYLEGQPGSAKQFNLGTYAPIEASQAVKAGDVSGILGQTAKGDYTKGMGALDNIIFRKSGQYGNVSKDVNQMQRNVDDTRKGFAGTQDEVQDYRNQKAAQGVTGLKSMLGENASSIMNPIQSQYDQYRAQDTAAYSSQKAAADAEILRRLKLAQPYLEPIGQYGAVDKLIKGNNFGQFLNTNQASYDINNFADAQSAEKYNRLMGLLGTGQTLAPSGAAGSSSASMNEKALNDYLKKIMGTNLYTGYQANVGSGQTWDQIQAAAKPSNGGDTAYYIDPNTGLKVFQNVEYEDNGDGIIANRAISGNEIRA